MNADRPDPQRPEDSEPDPGLDVEAAFREIVANYGPPSVVEEGDGPVVEEPDEGGRRPVVEEPDEGGRRPVVEEPDGGGRRPVVEEPDEGGRLETPDPDRLRGLFRPAWSDPMESEASWEDEGHFVPPPPPPLPTLDPRRKLAWIGLFGAPTLMLVLLVLGVYVPGWVGFLLAVSFIGGFVYLVATMNNGRHDWPGDDGAVL